LLILRPRAALKPRRGRSSKPREQPAILVEMTIAEELGCGSFMGVPPESRRLLGFPQQPLDRGAKGGEIVRVFDQ
jgi:hypothetical protein